MAAAAILKSVKRP